MTEINLAGAEYGSSPHVEQYRAAPTVDIDLTAIFANRACRWITPNAAGTIDIVQGDGTTASITGDAPLYKDWLYQAVTIKASSTCTSFDVAW